MPRIALVSSSFDPYTGGVEEHVLRVSRVLRARGHAVEVWTVDRGEHLGVRQVDGMTVRDLPTPMPARRWASLLRFAGAWPRAARQWQRARRAFGPEVLHVHCFGPNGPYATGLARFARLPLVLSTHGETFMDADDVFERSRLVRRAMARALAEADAVTACSRYVADDLVGRFGIDRAEVVGNGVDLDEPGLPATQALPWPTADEAHGRPVRTVLAVGRMEHVKGFDLLLEAFLAARLDDDVHLVLGGDGPQRAELVARVTAAGAGARVHLPGRLGRREVVSGMAAASVVVVPSRVEAFGIAVLEGMRAGRPVIATDRGGPPEFVTDGETGFLVDPTDTDRLARLLERLLADPALVARVGAAARAAAEGWTWQAIVDRYEEIYTRVLRPARRRAGAPARRPPGAP